MPKIDITDMSDDEIRALGVSRTTAWRGKKRGWICVDYHVSRVPAPRADFDAESAYALVNQVWRSLASSPVWVIYQEDLITAAIERLYLYSGRSVQRAYQWTVARNTMTRELGKLVKAR